MIVHLIRSWEPTRRIIAWFFQKRAEELLTRFESKLDKKKSILDLGAGSCSVTKVLRKKGYSCTPVDIQNVSFEKGITPILYNGKTIPFKKKYDVVLLLFVLHHTPQPEQVLKEAKRVGKEIILLEDLYVNSFHKYLTFVYDSIVNLEFFGHPHTNKSDRKWKKVFRTLNLKLMHSSYQWCYGFVRHGLYHLKS